MSVTTGVSEWGNPVRSILRQCAPPVPVRLDLLASIDSRTAPVGQQQGESVYFHMIGSRFAAFLMPQAFHLGAQQRGRNAHLWIRNAGSLSRSGGRIENESCRQRAKRQARTVHMLLALAVLGFPAWAGQAGPVPGSEAETAAGPPSAPEPQLPDASTAPRPQPCSPGVSSSSGAPSTLLSGTSGRAPAGASVGVQPPVPCVPRKVNWYQTFVRGPQDKMLTPKDKGWLAARNLVDPFNLITIGGEAAISVGANSHSPYGPGMPGYGRYVGVSFTQDLTGEFFGTFLIPSLAHQDPHYHRMPHASIPRRIRHAVVQVVWTESDYGTGMPNYANLVGFAIDDGISNLYVPGRETALPASTARYATTLATAPIGNFINEFLPDVASHIHVQIVIIQRVINQVARSETANNQ